ISRTRGVTAAKAFFRKALKRHGEPRVIALEGFEATHAALRRMGMNNEFNYRSRQSGPDPHLPLPEQYCRTRSSEGKKPRGSNARLQALLQRSARRGRCGVGPEDRKRSVRCSRKLRHGSILYMVQHAGGVNLAPNCNRSRMARLGRIGWAALTDTLLGGLLVKEICLAARSHTVPVQREIR